MLCCHFHNPTFLLVICFQQSNLISISHTVSQSQVTRLLFHSYLYSHKHGCYFNSCDWTFNYLRRSSFLRQETSVRFETIFSADEKLVIYGIAEPENGREQPVAPRRLGPVDGNLPRAAQIRRRRGFNPAHGYEGGAQNNDDDNDS